MTQHGPNGAYGDLLENKPFVADYLGTFLFLLVGLWNISTHASILLLSGPERWSSQPFQRKIPSCKYLLGPVKKYGPFAPDANCAFIADGLDPLEFVLL